MGTTFSVGSRQPATVVGRIGLSVFFLFFAGIGSFVLIFLGRELLKSAQMYRWLRSDCTILESLVEKGTSSGNPYVFRVKYVYGGDVEGRTGTIYRRQYRGSSTYDDAAALVRRYPAGARSMCLVNPADPGDAVLERESLWPLPFLLIPLLFVGVGLGGIYFTWKKPSARAVSVPSPARGRNMGAGFFLLFALFGAGFLIPLFVMPAWGIVRAQNWKAVPCTIISSQVRTHSDSDGSTYSIDILYRYVYEGKEYQSSRYKFMGGSSSGRSGKQRIVDRYRPGTKATCYVNPDAPYEAVIDRGFTADMLFGLIPLVFVAVGVGGFFGMRRAAKKAGTKGSVDWLPQVKGEAAMTVTPGRAGQAVPVILKPGSSPLAKLIGMICIALFWNGIVSVFVTIAVGSWIKGKPEVCMSIFMIPFVAVGIGLLVGVLYSFMAMFNPRLRIAASSTTIPLGGTLSIGYQFSGRCERISRLLITLEGREEATYRRGTDTTTDRSTFAKIVLLDTTDPSRIAQGKAAVQVPPESMHSFNASHNKIVWSLVILGEIARWPDVKEEYPIVVTPGPAGQEEAV